jgi:nucleoside-diphosphate-sugar epimerase
MASVFIAQIFYLNVLVMKILVIGGTGLVGSRVCEKLKDTGNEVIVGTPSNGVNILTGEGLANALNGTDIVIDLSNSPSPDAQIALNFSKRQPIIWLRL